VSVAVPVPVFVTHTMRMSRGSSSGMRRIDADVRRRSRGPSRDQRMISQARASTPATAPVHAAQSLALIGQCVWRFAHGRERVEVTSVQSSVFRAAGDAPFHHGQSGFLHCMPGPGQSSCGHGVSGCCSQVQPWSQRQALSRVVRIHVPSRNRTCRTTWGPVSRWFGVTR
jgi:hypothetical protein